jgi:predicted enzyme related to lactoylglutathione lyase
MLTAEKVMTFVATNAPDASLAFYRDVLGLTFVEDSPYAIVFDLAGTMLRIQKTKDYTPPKHTMLGWEVKDVAAAQAALKERGVTFLNYGFPGQDERGIWTTPDGTRVAWFQDPDGNILSLTQFA